MPRRELKESVQFSGVGVHTGQSATLTVQPASSRQGLRFIRTDYSGNPVVPVSLRSTSPDRCKRCTVLECDGVRVSTGEHLLSALQGVGIADADLLLNGPEVPFLDGSALEFATALLAASIESANDRMTALQCIRPFQFQHKMAEYLVLPARTLRVSYVFQSKHSLLTYQLADWDGTNFLEQIAPARTFGFLEEVGPLLAAGLVKGASLANSVVFGKKHLLNNGLRFSDEPSRHKILDFLGDIAPLQAPLHGWVICLRSGHESNAHFVLVSRPQTANPAPLPPLQNPPPLGTRHARYPSAPRTSCGFFPTATPSC
jgi:UDP-3-O-acyl N-acetylglucosamine deacetylase